MLKWLILAAAAEAHGSHGHGATVHLEDLLAKIEKLPESVHREFADLVARTDAGEKITEFPLLRTLFAFSPLANTLMAIGLLTSLSVSVLWVSPPLEGLPLNFLVAFAAGCLMGNSLFHLMPSAICSGSKTLTLIPVLTFVAFAYIGKLIANSQGQSGHSHSHDIYAHQHTTMLTAEKMSHTAVTENISDEIKEDSQSTAVGKPADRELRRRGALSASKTAAAGRAAVVDTDTEVIMHTEDSRNGAFAIINIAADFLHNLVDGAALALAFDTSRDKGILSFVLMCAHEIPHQFGDFALLIQTGMPKGSAISAHLATSSGLAIGALMYGFAKKFYRLGDLVLPFNVKLDIEELADPALAGVFLYIATMGVFPELLDSNSNWSPLVTTAVQLCGLAAGLYLMQSV